LIPLRRPERPLLLPEQFNTIYTHAREAPIGRTLFVSGQFGIAPDGGMHADFAGQIGQAMANVEALLSAAGMALGDVRKTTFILTRIGDLPALSQARRMRWASTTPAAVTVLVAAALARPDALVEVEVTAVRQPGLFDRVARPGASVIDWLGRIAFWARRVAAVRGRRGDRLDMQGDWILRDLGLDRSEVESADELRRKFPFQ